MSRAGITVQTTSVSTTTSAATEFPPMHLVVQRAPNELRAVARAIPFGDGCKPTDFAGLFVLHHLYRYASTNPNIEPWETGLFRNTKMFYDVWMHSMSFLLDSSALAVIPSLIAPTVFPPEVFSYEQDQLELLAESLHGVATHTNSIPHCFFSRGHRYQAHSVACLLDATFNADLATVKAILENSRHPEILLSISGEVVVDGYPDIKRRGTALQFALRSGDTEMVELMASYLPPSEFMRQFESVFGADFAAFERKQKEDADTLFEGLEDAFNGASPLETTNALNHVPDPTSALQTKLTKFKSVLEEYVGTNPNHNDFILAKSYEIYEENWNPWSNDKLCLFSEQLIGLVQASAKKTSPFRLQDYAQGIYYRSKNEQPARSYNLKGMALDIRSVDDLGSSSCTNIMGACKPRVAYIGLGGKGAFFYDKIMSSKNSKLSELATRAVEQAHKPGA